MKFRMVFVLLMIAIMMVPAMPAAAAVDGVGLSCHTISIEASCVKFTIHAWTDSSTNRVFSVYIKRSSGTWQQLQCTGSNCSGTNFRLPLGTDVSQDFDWATETDLHSKIGGGALCVVFVANTLKAVQGATGSAEYNTIAFGGPLCCTPESVTLANWSVSAGKGGVQIEWSTGSEVNNLGFNIYRSRQNQIETATKLNDALIPGVGAGSQGGSSYSYLDSATLSRFTYYYWLEDVEMSGGTGAGYDTHILGGITALGQGSWGMPLSLAVVPNSGGIDGGKIKVFVANFKDTDADLATVYLVINKSPKLEGGIAVKYDVASGLFSIYDARKGSWQAGIRGGVKMNLASAYGALRGYSTKIVDVNDPNILRVNFMIKFSIAFAGQYNIYTMAQDAMGNNNGWKMAGTWAVN